MIAIERTFTAYLDDVEIITVLLPYTYQNGASSEFYLVHEDLHLRLTIRESVPLVDSIKYICQCEQPPEIGKQYWIMDEYGGKTDLQIGAIIRTPQFDENYFYNGCDLGAVYFHDRVIFKLWAPTAVQVKLKLAAPHMPQEEPLTMTRGDKGVWSIVVNRNLESYHYTYLVCVNLEWREVVDPYAVAATANGKLGVIVDLEKTRKARPVLPAFDYAIDAIIYETHIRDFTISPTSGVVNRGKYTGAAEINTFGKEGQSTCLSYVKSLGVTHIEFLPFNDFEGVDELKDGKDYNWGYNPLHFNVPEGSYSSNPNDPYARINELKQLIASIHEQGLRVLMDVVFNHVYIREQSSFEKIVPGYFFRHDEFGMPSNGTGVGNDIASERLMVRKFIVDSVRFWMNEYQLDGFRFDLMGILDVDTMNEVRKAVDEIDESAIIIGEGWDLNTPISSEQKASIRNQKQLPRIGQFNDWFRDSIKGSTFNVYDRGYALGNDHYYEAAKQVLAGSIGLERKEKGIFLHPNQSVNYVECHDNHTLWDKLMVCHAEYSDEVKRKRHRLATVMVLLAQGIPFLHSGQEFFRTKKGDGNSYRSPDEVNQIDWDLKGRYLDNVEYIKGIIEIRKSHRAFRLPTADLIRQHMKFASPPKPVIGCLFSGVEEFGKWKSIYVLFNPTVKEQTVEVPLEGEWHMLANNQTSSIVPISSHYDSSLLIEPCSSYILVN